MNVNDVIIAHGTAYIDFYVDPKEYEKRKTENGRRNVLYNTLFSIFDPLKFHQNDGFTFRYINLEANAGLVFGERLFCEINDIGYCQSYQPEKREDKHTFRCFGIYYIATVDETGFRETGVVKIPSPIKTDEYIINFSSAQIV